MIITILSYSSCCCYCLYYQNNHYDGHYYYPTYEPYMLLSLVLLFAILF